MSVPTRDEIQTKITELKKEGVPSLYDSMSEWLDLLDLPENQIVAGATVNPKEQILSDLDSYA